MPEVSIIIPTHNRANLIGRAIQSVLDQTYRDFQLIVVDDASADGTEGVVRAFNDNTIQYIRHMMNRGANSARNTGIENAKGEYIAFLDDDDEWLPEYLDQMISYLEAKDRSIGLVYCSFYRIDSDTSVVLNIRKQQKKQRKEGSSIGFPSRWVVRKKVFEKAGMFDETMKCFQDVEMSFRISKHYRAVYFDKPLVRLYFTEGSLSSNFHGKERYIKILLNRYSEIMNGAELADWYIALTNSYFAEGIFEIGRQSLMEAMRTNPFNLKIPLLFLGSFLGYRLYLDLTRILNLNVAKVIRIINRFMKG